MPETRNRFQIRRLTIILVAAALVLVAGGLVYVVTPAGSLPGFVPGHEAHSSHHHTKHGLLLFGLAVACLVGAWFSTGEVNV